MITRAQRAREQAGKIETLEGALLAHDLYDALDAADALREVVRRVLPARSGEPICACRNRNAVKAGTEKACWYCELRSVLAAYDAAVEPKA